MKRMLGVLGAAALTSVLFVAAPADAAVPPASAGVSVTTWPPGLQPTQQTTLVGVFAGGQYVGVATTGGRWGCLSDGCSSEVTTPYGTTRGPWPIASTDGVSMTGLCDWFANFANAVIDTIVTQTSTLTCDLSFNGGPTMHTVLAVTSAGDANSPYPGVFTSG
jgi:hypothetical protein